MLAADTNITVRYLTGDDAEQFAKASELHVAKAQGCEAFVTFDRRFASVATALSEMKVRVPWRMREWSILAREEHKFGQWRTKPFGLRLPATRRLAAGR